MNEVYIAFGSNIGDSENTIALAIKKISESGMSIKAISKLYKTKPYGYLTQPDFTNGMLLVHTNLSCREVLRTLLLIEGQLGRVREIHWGPRVIDLDIIFFNNEVYNEADLIVPHGDMQNRDFVLKPMCELNGEFIHPILNCNMKELLNKLNKK